MKAKLVTGKFFMERMLPETATHLARIQTGADTHDGAAGGGVLTIRHPELRAQRCPEGWR